MTSRFLEDLLAKLQVYIDRTTGTTNPYDEQTLTLAQRLQKRLSKQKCRTKADELTQEQASNQAELDALNSDPNAR